MCDTYTAQWHFNMAVISVHLKRGKDASKCDSYRLASLVCCDNKILSKALALWLETVLNKIPHPDRIGFIKGRQSFENLQHLQKIKVISLDAYKHLTTLDLLLTQLWKFGFCTEFISWIKVYYSAPQSVVLTNNVIPKHFSSSNNPQLLVPPCAWNHSVCGWYLSLLLRSAKADSNCIWYDPTR